MADTKISALSAGTAAPGDEIPVNRSGSNFKITAGDILKINGGTITADSPVLNLTQTWNNAAVTFTGLKFNGTDTASGASSLLMDLQVGGTSQFSVFKDGLVYPGANRDLRLGPSSSSFGVALGVSGAFSAGYIGDVYGMVLRQELSFGICSSGVSAKTVPDTRLFRDAAGVFAQRNSTNAQTFRVYNTYTDASNYERAKISWSSNVLQIGTEKAGTGTARALELQTDGTTRLTIAATGSITTGAGVDFFVNASRFLGFSASTLLYAPSNGVLGLYNAATTDFNRLQFGGSTSSFPALKRSGAGLISRLADDSADAAFTASTLTASSSAANTSAIASTGYSLTGSSAVSMVDLAGTWNTTGTPTAIKLNVTDTASNAASLLMDLGTGGGSFVSKFSVKKDGAVTMNGNLTISTKNIVTDTTTGTKIGTDAAQKLGFWNATPIVQPVNSTAIDTLLVDTGLRASGGTANFSTAIETSSTIKTGAPTGGTAAAWKLGAVATVSPTSPNRTIEVDIGGTIYYLHAKTTND